MADSFEVEPNQAIIINTDINHGAGVHWLVVVNPMRYPKDLFIIDPLGPENKRGTSNGMSSDDIIANRAADLGLNRLVFFSDKIQSDNSEHCGQFSEVIATAINELLRESPMANYKHISLAIEELFN